MNKIRPRLTQEEWEVIQKLRQGEEPIMYDKADADELKDFLDNHNINENSVDSVKFWQTQSGETRFSIVTKNKKEVDLEELFDELVEDLRSYRPKFQSIERENKVSENCFVFAPSDIHIGKYSSDDETGDSYNVKKAVERVYKGTEGIIEMTSRFDIDKVFFVIGNDVLHTDNARSTTTSGTPQDSDRIWHECFVEAERMYVRVIETLLTVADVHVVFAPSNHDYITGFMLSRVIAAFFNDCPNVTFDVNIKHRKYFSYGSSLIGISHGDGAKEHNLPLLMAEESSELWPKCSRRYWYLGHIHHKKKVNYQVAKDYPGVTVEYLRSPSGTDSWHHKNGFEHSPKAIEGFIHNREMGQIARLTYNF